MKNKEKFAKVDVQKTLLEENKNLLQLIEHERETTMAQMLKYFGHNQYREQVWKYSSFLFGTLLAVVGFYLAWVASIHTEDSARLREYNQREAAVIKESIDEKLGMMKIAIKATLDMRTINYDILQKCKYHHPQSIEEQEKIRWKARQKVIEVLTLSPFIFDNSVGLKIKELINFDENVKNVCTFSAKEYDEKIHNYQTQLRNLMGEFITEEQKKMNQLK